MRANRDHGGGLDAAMAQYGGTRSEWVDLSTGINPVPYPLPEFPAHVWTALPDQVALDRLTGFARSFWSVPEGAGILPAAGASALIAQLPRMCAHGTAKIPGPTYNEHAAAFQAAGWAITDEGFDAVVAVHPNNPDGRMWKADSLNAPLTIIDESFCDVTPEASHIARATLPGTIILKSFGKFWGLGGVRLGFAIGDPGIIADLREAIGPWHVSGPAMAIGAEALADPAWADEARIRLINDAARLDALLNAKGAVSLGGTALFRLYQVQDAKAAQAHLAQHKIWSRIFPYSDNWLRLGLPHPDRWEQVEAAF